MSSINNIRKIDMHPPKEFFFCMTLDITPEETILELIDTFIEWYMYYNNRNRLKKRGNIKIQITDEKFVIESNYPGPPKDMVSNLLQFGRRVEKGCSKIGAYGIGTKRALFKLGRDIYLKSDDGSEYFSVYIDKNWIESKKNWKLKLETGESKKKLYNKIIIRELYDGIKVEFRSPKFINDFRTKVKDTYAYFIEGKEVTIKINGENIKPFNFRYVFEEGRTEPYYKKLFVDGIFIKILAGVTKKENNTYGWYVFCNNRLVVKGDTSDRMGFDNYNNVIYKSPDHDIFLGLIFFNSFLFCFDISHKKYLKKGSKISKDLRKLFSIYQINLSENDKDIEIISEKDNWKIKDKKNEVVYEVENIGNKLVVFTDPIKLPWKSSKDDIREDSLIYRVARDYMRKVTKRFFEYISEIMKNKKENIENLVKFATTEKIENFLKEYDKINEKEEIFRWIDEDVRKEILKGTQRQIMIQFWEPPNLLERVKIKLGNLNMSNEEMGKKILQYYMEMEGIKYERTRT